MNGVAPLLLTREAVLNESTLYLERLANSYIYQTRGVSHADPFFSCGMWMRAMEGWNFEVVFRHQGVVNCYALHEKHGCTEEVEDANYRVAILKAVLLAKIIENNP